MAQFVGVRTTAQTGTTESRIIREVGAEIGLLEPNEAPLITLLSRMKKSRGVKSPTVEWMEDDYTARWGLIGAAQYDSDDTTWTVTDSRIVVAGDVLLIPKVNTTVSAPEQVLVYSVPSNSSILVVRGFAGTTADTVATSQDFTIIGSAHAEGGAVATPKNTTIATVTSYVQDFKTACSITDIAAATAVYGAASGDRMREHAKKLKEHKIAMNRALLFSKPSYSVSYTAYSTNPVRSTMGINSVISSNITNAGGILTRKQFEAYSRQSFRYGAKQKILLAPPLLCSAINEWGNKFLSVSPGEKKFGVKIQQVETAHGTWLLVNDWMLESGSAGYGFSNTAFSLDLDQIGYFYLAANGENLDTKIYEDVVKDGSTKKVDEIRTVGGFEIHQEKFHSKLWNITDYQE